LVLDLKQSQQSYVFTGLQARPVVSLFRGFSAPVRLQQQLNHADLAFLYRHDTDGFNRWSAGQQLATEVLLAQIAGEQATDIEAALVESMRALLIQSELSAAELARMIELPAAAYLAELCAPLDPVRLHVVREALSRRIAQALETEWLQCYRAMPIGQDYRYGAQPAGQRALGNRALGYLLQLDKAEHLLMAEQQYRQAAHMTERMAAFRGLVHARAPVADALIQDFESRWRDEALVMDQWLSVQATIPDAGNLERVKRLFSHACFELTNPNRVRALLGAFANSNYLGFHREDGAGYDFLAQQVIELQALNPQIAARLCGAMKSWRRLEPVRSALMHSALSRIANEPNLASDVYEVVGKMLESG
jgi:aminopeptidase N